MARDVFRILKEETNVVDYGAKLDGATDDTAALIRAQAAGWQPYIPGDYGAGVARITDWIPMLSGRRWHGDGEASIVSNDKTNANTERHACFLAGNHHPANMATQTGYALNAIAAGDPSVTCTTAGDAANFSAGQLVIVGSATNLSGVSRHAQLSKVQSVSGGTVTLNDPIAVAISDPTIWTIGGTDASNGAAIYAVEDVVIERIGFKGRSLIASKGATYRARFSDIAALDTANLIAANMATFTAFERWRGSWTSRFVEFAFNSYRAVARDINCGFVPPAGLQAGESMILPIHLGEQGYGILLDDTFCHVDGRYTPNNELAQIKGSHVTIRRADWRHNGAAGSYAISIPDSAYTGFFYDEILFDDCRLAAPGKARIGLAGGAAVAAENPRNVEFRGGAWEESVTSEAFWFQAGGPFSVSARNRTGKKLKVSTTARYPTLAGYRRAS